MEDEGELSMRGKQPAQQDYNDNMISDDDHVWDNILLSVFMINKY